MPGIYYYTGIRCVSRVNPLSIILFPFTCIKNGERIDSLELETNPTIQDNLTGKNGVTFLLANSILKLWSSCTIWPNRVCLCKPRFSINGRLRNTTIRVSFVLNQFINTQNKYVVFVNEGKCLIGYKGDSIHNINPIINHVRSGG